MSACVRPRFLEDYPDDVMPLIEKRICDKCGTETMWASPRQKKNGRHWGCIPGNTFWRCTDEQETRVILDVLAAFPGSTIEDVEVGPTEVGYVGEGAGPCALCRGPIRRYGDGGLPLCQRCDLERKRGNDQS